MELRPGYKRTEVGVIPEAWDVSATSDLVDPNAPICYGVVQVGRDTANGVPIVAIKHLKDIAGSPLHRASADVEGPYSRSRVRNGDVLISIKGTIGRVGVVPERFEGNISRELARLRFKPHISPKYISHQLESDATQARIVREVVGTTRMEFSIGTLRNFLLPVPKQQAEQDAIAMALSDVDGLVNGLDRLIAKKRDLKQAAMQQLLTGQARLPGFSGEWEAKLLGEIAHIKTGSRNNEDKVEDGEYPFFVRSEVVERINTYSYDCEAILVPGEGRIGNIFHYVNGRFDVHQRVYAISQFSANASAKFVHLYMAKNFGTWAMQNTVKATVDSLRLPTFQTFEMLIPPTIAEQTAIATVLSDMDAEIAALEARRDKTRALKQAMMQELLTGRIRLIEPTAQVIPLAAAKTAATPKRGHNEHFNEAVVIAALAQRFADEDHPLGRFRYTKLSYLLHRHAEGNTEQYLRKAAGPYNPTTRYGGAEKIALAKGYVREHRTGKYAGFVAAGNVAEAERYFRDWYGDEALHWLEQFRKLSHDDLELFATVFYAIDAVAKQGGVPSFKSVKQFIADDPEWRNKLRRPLFSDDNIVRAGRQYRDLFGEPPTAAPPT